MKKRILIFVAMIATLMCFVAISASAKTVYMEKNSDEILFSGTIENNQVVSYDTTKRFPLVDANGKALTWYLTGETGTDADSNTIKYVTKVLTSEIFDASKGNYTGGKDFAKTVVSANFDNDGTVTSLTSTMFGGINSPDYSTNLLFLYIPDSVTTIGDRFCQNVHSVIEINFSDTSKCSSIGSFFALWAYSLRKINIPSNVEKLISGDNRYGAFQECKRLEEVTFAPNSKLKEIGAKTFADCDSLTSLTFPNSFTTIGSKPFQGSGKLTYINLGAGFTTFKASYGDFFSFTYQVGHEVEGKTLTLVIPGNNISYALANDNLQGNNKIFGYMFPSAINIQYAGSEEQFNNLVALVTESTYDGTSKFSNNGGLKNSNITYVNSCDVFYQGEHMGVDHDCRTDDKCTRNNCFFEIDGHEPESVTISYVKYTDKGTKTVVCNEKDCLGNGTFDVAPIFDALGYSIKENNSLGIISTYKINVEALKDFEEVNGSLTFGVIMANANFGDVAEFMSKNNEGKYILNSNYGVQLEVTSRDFSKINATIEKFTENEASLNLVMALYVVDESGISFIQKDGDYAGTVEKGGTILDIVTIVKIAELKKVELPFTVPANVPTGNEENN